MRERRIPALRFRVLTRFYDPLMATVLRESAWKAQLVDQVDCALGALRDDSLAGIGSTDD